MYWLIVCKGTPMSLLELIADLPVNANLRLKIVELEKENVFLKSEVLRLSDKTVQLEAEIATLKKPKGIYNAPVTRVG